MLFPSIFLCGLLVVDHTESSLLVLDPTESSLLVLDPTESSLLVKKYFFRR